MNKSELVEKEIFIHVGMPKSASTFLQRNYFNQLTGVYFASDDVLINLIRKITVKNPITIDIEFEKKIIDNFLLNIEENKVVISDEALVGYMFDSFHSFESITFLLKKLFPSAHIILVLRKQDSIIESIYKQYLHEGHAKTFNRFFKENIDLDCFHYSVFVQKYNQLWNNNVLVLAFEEFRSDKERFFSRLSNFLKIDYFEAKNSSSSNKGFSLISMYIALIFNRFLYREYNSCGFIIEKPFYKYFYSKFDKPFYKVMTQISQRITLRWLLQNIVDKIIYIKYSPLNQKQKEYIKNNFVKSNKILDEKIETDLKKYKYY